MVNNWPPEINTLIEVNCDDRHFIGKVIYHIKDINAIIIKLNNNTKFIDTKLIDLFDIKKQGLLLVKEDYDWDIYGEKKNIKQYSKFTRTIYDGYSDNVKINDNLIINDDNSLFTDYTIRTKCEQCPTTVVANNEDILNYLKQKPIIINKKETGVPTSPKLIYEGLLSPHDEIGEGKKLKEYIEKVLNNYGITMDYDIKNGYLHIIKSGCCDIDVVTRELIPDLKFFDCMYDRPINYDLLKTSLFRNSYQKKIKKDMEILEEAKKILSLEYLIAIQPFIEYQCWCVIRLILCWMSDPMLFQNIRKIKVLINQYRCRPDIEYNKENGILPSIVIYPKYGYKSYGDVIEGLNCYSVFIKSLAWVGSIPTYFIKVDELMHYTNGINDLKLYFRNVIKASNNSFDNDVFDEKYTSLNSSVDLFKIID